METLKKQKRKTVTPESILYELRNVAGNPFVHMFGVGLPILLATVFSHVAAENLSDEAMMRDVATSIYLGIGTIIPLATIFMGYSVTNAQEIQKGIPDRMRLFGISMKETLINRAISEILYMVLAFAVFFGVGIAAGNLTSPAPRGVLTYAMCILLLALILLVLGHAISSLCRSFGLTYMVTMILYFLIMILSGMMGVSYESLPKAVRAISRLIPITYINNDFLPVWKGKSYQFGPILQAYLFCGALSGVLLFIAARRQAEQ